MSQREKHGFLLIIKYICFSGVPLLFTLVLLEILMIFLEPYLFKGFYQYDRDLGFRVRPYCKGMTNRFGFNDQDYSLDKHEGIIRVLFVGDSFGWAGGRDGNYTALLERRFEEHYGSHRVDVINCGYPMTHTGEQLAMLKKYGLQYNPDIVFLGFFAGNDFIDADPYRKRIVVNDTYFDIDVRHERSFLGYPIVPRSRLWSFVKQKWTILQKVILPTARQGTPSRQTDKKGPPCTFSEEDFLKIERSLLEFCNRLSIQKGVYRKNIDFIFNSFARMRDLLSRRGIDLIVGIYPDEFQVNASWRNRIFQHFGLDKADYDIGFMQDLLSAQLKANRITYLDLLETFRAHAGKTPLYLCRDSHWSQAGSELAADTIFQYLLPRIDSLIGFHKESLSLEEGRTRRPSTDTLLKTPCIGTYSRAPSTQWIS